MYLTPTVAFQKYSEVTSKKIRHQVGGRKLQKNYFDAQASEFEKKSQIFGRFS